MTTTPTRQRARRSGRTVSHRAVGNERSVDTVPQFPLDVERARHRREGARHRAGAALIPGTASAATSEPYDRAGCSVPQYLHLEAAIGRSSDKQAGQVLTGGGSPKTVIPRRAWTAL